MRLYPWLPVLGAAVFVAWALGKRTRGFDAIHPDLRAPWWRIRSPSVGPTLLRLARQARVTTCVDGVTVEAVTVVSTDGTPITAYVYRPDAVADGGPAMLFTHGGGLVLGSAAAYHAKVSAHARDIGIVVVSTEYRLAPEHPFPTALDDIHGAYRWMVGNGPALRIDPCRIVIGGDSAGGGLAAALCQRLLDAGDTMPVFQLLVYPMLDDRTTLRSAPGDRGQLVWTEASNRFGWSSYLGRAPQMHVAPEYAVPARRADLSGLPDAWIGVGDLDLFYDEDVAYAERLRAAGIACELVVVNGAFHGFDVLGETEVGDAFRNRFVRAVRVALGT